MHVEIVAWEPSCNPEPFASHSPSSPSFQWKAEIVASLPTSPYATHQLPWKYFFCKCTCKISTKDIGKHLAFYLYCNWRYWHKGAPRLGEHVSRGIQETISSCSKRLAPGWEKMRWSKGAFLPEKSKQNATFYPISHNLGTFLSRPLYRGFLYSAQTYLRRTQAGQGRTVELQQ